LDCPASTTAPPLQPSPALPDPLLPQPAGAALESKLEQFCRLLQLELPDLALLLIKQPSLINNTAACVGAKLDHIQALLALERGAALQVARTCPALLTLAPAGVAHKWQLLQRWAAPVPAWRQYLAAATPATLGLYLCFSTRRLARLVYFAQLDPPPPWGLHKLLMMSQREVAQALPAMEGWLQAQELLGLLPASRQPQGSDQRGV
jgi:hypothetical protein